MNIKKRYLLVLLSVLFIVSMTYAVGVVTITPANPIDSDNLTCYVDGIICNSVNACIPHWTSSSFSGELFLNPLLNSYTAAGTSITCNAWLNVPPIGSQSAGSSSVLIGSNPPPNTPPLISGRIPDYTINENSGLNDNLVPLWNYANDAETPVNQLNFQIRQQTNSGVVNCVIDDQRNNATNPGVFLDCTTQLNQVGYSDITVRVTDVGSLWAEDVFRVTVVGMNNPPTVLFLPDVIIAEDSGLNQNLIDLWNYASDVETSQAQLIFTITSESGLTITDCSIRNNRYIECLTLPNQNGVSDVTVQVQDAGGLTASDTFRITVTPVNDAPSVSNIPDVIIYEDLPNSATPLIDLNNFATDPDGDAITWTASSSTPNINVIIGADNVVSYTLAANWFGTATIIFTATDAGGLTASDTVNIIVYPVNDIPSINGLPNLTYLEDFGTANHIIDLWAFTNDIETPDTQLIFNLFSESAPGIVDCHIESNQYIDCTSQQDQNGVSDIAIRVQDPQGGINYSSFRITLTPVNDVPTINPLIPNQAMPEDHPLWSLDLTSYGYDIENLQTALRWSVAGVDVTKYTTSFDANQRIITFIPVANACGTDAITLTVTDINSAIASQNINVTLNCVNDIPTISPVIPDQTRNEDSPPWILDLTSYGHDVEDAQTALRWSISGVDTNLFNVSFDTNQRIITFTPVANAIGSDAITLTVTDLGGGSASQNIRITLNSVNDIPWISPVIPNQIKDEGSAPWGIDLSLYEHDVEDNIIGLHWSVSGVNTTLLTINIDPITYIATFVLANSDVYGTNNIIFILTDSQGANVSQNVLITINSINDAPIVSDIPNINFNEDTIYTTTWNLNNYVSDVDNSDAQIIWTFTGNHNVSITINPNRTITFSATPNWNGAEVITFRATDPAGLYSEKSMIVSVNPINDGPVVNGIPNIIIPEDGVDFSIDLDNYVNDPDNIYSQLTWTASGNHNISLFIDPATHLVILTPFPNWNGQETIIYKVCDPSMLCSSANSTITVTSVDDAPVVSDIPNINFNEDGNYILNLNQYVSDIDNIDSQITWSVSGNINIIVNINASNFAIISAPLNWNGVETLNFTARDPSGLSDSDISTVLVNAVNDVPTISPVIPDQTRNEDSTPWNLDLTSYGHDIENLQTALRWSVSGVDTTKYTASFDANQRIITFIPIANACGSDVITLTVTDLEGAVASQDINVILTCVNDAPVVSDIPNVQILEDSTPVTLIQLDNFVSDIENPDANITWTYSPVPANVGISIDPITHTVTFSILTPNWNGNTTVIFRATDSGGLFAEDSVTIIVLAVNDAPVVSDIPNTNFDEDTTTTINLDSYVTDVDNTPAQMTWSVSGNPNIIVNINPTTHVASLSSPLNWNGVETLNFTACDLGGLCDSDTTIVTVNPVNDAPVVNMPDMITIPEDSNINLVLNSYVIDVDNLASQINWSVSGNINLAVTIDNVNKIATIVPNANWNGIETLTFTATDPNGAFGSDSLIINVSAVNDAPVINNFNPINGTITLNEGSSQAFSISANDVDGPSLIYSWILDGIVIPGATAANYNYNAIDGPLSHVLISIVSDGSLNSTNTWNININNVPPQAVSAGGPYNCAIGHTAMLTGSATDPGTSDILTYSWDFYNDGSIDAVGQNVFFPCSIVGLSNIRLSVSDGAASVNASTTVTTYDIVINEFSPNPISGSDWVELYNNDPINSFTLNNWELRDTGATQMATITGQTIPPHGFLVVTVGNRLNNGSDSINLFDNLANLIDSYNYTGLTFANITEGRIPDGIGGFTQNNPTPGAPNVALGGVNLPPIANAGADQIAATGNSVLLSGNLSSDPNAGDILSYSWNINSAPIGSLANLIGNNTINPSFTPDLNGIYIIELRATDNGIPNLSDSDIVIISASNITNLAPIISSIDVIPSVVNLNGVLTCVVSAVDPNGDPVIINYSWTTNNPLVNLVTFTTNTLNLSLVPNEAYGDIINCTATPSDGLLTGASASDTSSIITNSPPTATILSPANNSIFTYGDIINFFGTGFDSEEGLLSGASLQWTSNIDGLIGTGSAFTTNSLSVNIHIINLTVCDSTLLCNSKTITVTINPIVINNTAPVIAGISNQSLIINSGLNSNIIDLWAFTNDAETPDSGLIYSVVAQTGLSIVNCAVTSNRYISCTTQPGQTGISDVTIQVQDSGLLSDTAIFRVNVTSGAANQNPVISIVNPLTGSVFTQGSNINFIGVATDPEDGIITSNIRWYSSINGLFGTGGNFNINSLSTGTHLITARVNDSSTGTAFTSIAITINAAANQNPVVVITSPSTGNSFVQGIMINFAGTANDPEDGVITPNLRWYSSINGLIGSGGSFNLNTLSLGMHTITARANDSSTGTGSASIFITITAPGGQTIITSWIDGIYYASAFDTDPQFPTITTSTIINSTVSDASLLAQFTILNAYIYNSTIARNSNINNCIILNSVFAGTCTNSFIDPTFVDGTSSVASSNIINSNITNNSIITGSTIISSTIKNSQIDGYIIENANVTNNLICSGIINGVSITLCHPIIDYKNSAPVAVISAVPTSGVDSLNVSFSAGESSDINVGGILNDIINYSWNFGDGNTGTGLSTVHQYGVGTFTVVLTVTDNFNAKDSKTATITVSSSSSPSSGGGGGGGGSSGGGGGGCSVNLKELTAAKTITTRNLCTIGFIYNNIKYETKIKSVTADSLTMGIGDIQSSAELNKEGRLSLTATKDLIFNYDKLDFGKVVTTLSIGDKLKTSTIQPTTTTTPTTSSTSTTETTSATTVPKESSSIPTGAAVVSGIRKNAVGVGIMLAIILIGSVVYYVFSRKKY